MDYQLGDKVYFSAELIRKQSAVVSGSLNDSEAKNLENNGGLPEKYTRYNRREHNVRKEGIVCGVRTIKYKGFSDYLGYEEGYGFKTIEHRRVYLIATTKTGFHRVLPEDIELVNLTTD